jgi:hypothetical protein
VEPITPPTSVLPDVGTSARRSRSKISYGKNIFVSLMLLGSAWSLVGLVQALFGTSGPKNNLEVYRDQSGWERRKKLRSDEAPVPGASARLFGPSFNEFTITYIM